jgi:hypothetical protein
VHCKLLLQNRFHHGSFHWLSLAGFFLISWHKAARFQNQRVDLSDAVMANGKDLILPNKVCSLCGNKGGLKIKCKYDACLSVNSAETGNPAYFHATCARQAGLEASSVDVGEASTTFFGTFPWLHCLRLEIVKLNDVATLQ